MGWCSGCAGRVTSKASSTAGWVHASGHGRRPGGARSAGAPQGAREATRRGTGCGPEEYGRLRPEGYSGPNRVLPRLPPTALRSRAFSTAPGDSECERPRRTVPHPLPKVTAVPDDAAASDRRCSTISTPTSAPRSRARVPRSCILAGPGAGKTRVLTRRVAYRLATSTADPGHVLVITFTRKAASELGTRLGALGLRGQAAAGTFHAVALAQLRQRWTDAGMTPPSLLDRKAGLLAPLVSQSAKRGGASAVRAARRRRGRDRVGEGAHDQPRSRTRARATTPAAARRCRPPIVASIYERYERIEARALADRLRRRAHPVRTRDARRPRLRRRAALEVPTSLRRRVPRHQPSAAPPARGLARRASRPVRRRRPRPGHLRLERRGRQPRSREFGDRYPGSTIVRLEHELPIDAADRARRVSRCSHDREAGARCRPTGRSRRSPSYPTDVAEAAAVARRVRDRRGPTMGWRHIARARPHQRAAHVARRGAARGAGAVPGARRRQPARAARGASRGCATRAIAGRHRSLPASPTSRPSLDEVDDEAT